MFAYHLPNLSMIDQIIPMNQQIPESDDPGVISDSGSHVRIIADQAIHCLSDDFEVTFNCCSQKGVGLVFLKSFGRSSLNDKYS